MEIWLLGADIAELSMAITLNVVLDIPLISTVVHVEPADRVRNMWDNLTRWLEEVYVDTAPRRDQVTLFSIPNGTPCPRGDHGRRALLEAFDKSTAFELEDTDVISVIFGTSPDPLCIQMIALHSSPWLDEDECLPAEETLAEVDRALASIQL